MNSSIVEKSVYVTSVKFTDTMMTVFLSDGREVSISLEWCKSLRDATMIQLENWRLIGKGEGIHWEDLDKDLLIESLLK